MVVKKYRRTNATHITTKIIIVCYTEARIKHAESTKNEWFQGQLIDWAKDQIHARNAKPQKQRGGEQ
jgi:hypothetical protein